MREHETRHPVGERRLADTGRAAKQPGMRKAPAAIGVEQRLLSVSVAIESGGFTRVRRLDLLGFVVAHEAMLSSAIGAVAGSKRSCTTFQMRSATAGLGSVASINTQRIGSLNAITR